MCTWVQVVDILYSRENKDIVALKVILEDFSIRRWVGWRNVNVAEVSGRQTFECEIEEC